MREQRYDFDCSVAVGWSLLKYYKIKVDYNELLKASKVCPVDGLRPQKLVSLLHKFGLSAKIVEHKTIKYLKTQINNGHPVIVLVQHRKEYKKSWRNTNIYGHYQIVFGYNNKKLLLYDPSIGGTKILTYDQLNARWHDGWNGEKFVKAVIIN